MDITDSLDDYVYELLEDKAKRGADSMLKSNAVLVLDRAVAEAEARKAREFAEKLIIDEEPVDKIERYTGLNATELKQIANSLGKTLVI